jgi:hypothetical protein
MTALAEPDVSGDVVAGTRPAAGELLRHHGEWFVLALIVVAAVAAMFATHRHGHWWGDDWALYVRQAKGLVEGNADQVRLDNEFTVTVSPGTEFSPPLYPWGFPLMLAPFVAVFGTENLDRLAIVEVLCAAVFVAAWYPIARRRLGAVVALAGAVVLAFSPLYVGWTEQIQSELPFMAVAMCAVLYVDRVNRRGALVDRAASWWPPVAAGLLAAGAFTVRREGLAVVPAIFVAQLVGVVLLWPRRPSEPRAVGALVARLATPYVAAFAAVQLLQAALPSTLVPRYRGTGLGNITEFAPNHVGNVMKSLGFQRQWATSPSVFGNETLGTWLVGVFIALVVAGIVIAVARHAARDLPVLAYLGSVFVIGGSFRVASARYVATVGPIVLIFAALAVVALLRLRLRATPASFIVAGLLALLAVSNGWQVADRIGIARRGTGGCRRVGTHGPGVGRDVRRGPRADGTGRGGRLLQGPRDDAVDRSADPAGRRRVVAGRAGDGSARRGRAAVRRRPVLVRQVEPRALRPHLVQPPLRDLPHPPRPDRELNRGQGVVPGRSVLRIARSPADAGVERDANTSRARSR